MDPAATTARRPPAGSVVVDMPAAAAAAPPARTATAAPGWTTEITSMWTAAAAAPPARAATAAPGWTWTTVITSMWTAAAAAPPAPAAAARGAAAQAAAAPPPAPAPAPAPTGRRERVAAAGKVLRRLTARLGLAACLFVLGLAAAALALFTMTLSPDAYSSMGPCTPTDEEAADLRLSSKLLLLAASAQVLAAAAALLMPMRSSLPTYAAFALGVGTAKGAADVVRALVACHGHLDGALAVNYWVFVAAGLAAIAVVFVYGLGDGPDD